MVRVGKSAWLLAKNTPFCLTELRVGILRIHRALPETVGYKNYCVAGRAHRWSIQTKQSSQRGRIEILLGQWRGSVKEREKVHKQMSGADTAIT